jgi:hypothetical protein
MKILRWTAILMAMAIVLGVSMTFLMARHRLQLANSLLADLQQLQVGSGNSQQVRDFIKKHDLRSSQESPAWSADSGVFGTGFDNSLLVRFHLAPPTGLGVALKVENEAIRYILVDYYVACRGSMTSGVHIGQFPESPGEPPFEISVYPAGGKPPNIGIKITSAASPQQRANAFGLDLRCLTRLGGCAGASELLPSVGRQGLGCGTPQY